jgi:hypothetical protein
MKYIIIILIIVALYFIVTQENFDVSANLNQLTNSELRFNKPVNIPISPNQVEDREVPNPVLFYDKVRMTILQKLKAINNILERIKDVSITESNSKKLSDNIFSNVVAFNPALLPVKTFEPDMDKLDVLNKLITNQLKFYSGGQYVINILNVDNAYGAETDDQYKISYILYGIIDNIQMKIFIELIIIKSMTTETDLNVVFTELRIDNPNVYITPYNDNKSDKYESINNYNKSLK